MITAAAPAFRASGFPSPERDATGHSACAATPLTRNYASRSRTTTAVTQHPLRGRDSGTSYRYIDWSVPGGEWAEAFRNFGEATVRYPMTGVEPPNLDEVFEIADIYERALFPQPYLAQGSK
jgi:hypothetical protein